MQQAYLNYVNRFEYHRSIWPPDIGLAELHSRCSQPGPINPNGIRCPCCGNQSKLKLLKWKHRNIEQDFQQNGAVYAYFFLMKYYMIFIFLVMLVNSIYPLYATYYVCQNFNPFDTICLKIGVLYYLEYNKLISVLRFNDHESMVTVIILLTIFTTTFVVLLVANIASIPFLSKMEKIQIQKNPPRMVGNILLFHNLKQQYISKIREYLTQDKSIKILRVIPLREIKKYRDIFFQRSNTFYKLMALYVSCQDPLKFHKRNEKLKKLHSDLQKQRQKLTKYCDRALVVFQTQTMASQIHRLYRFPEYAKWWNGLKAIFLKAGLAKQIKQLPLLSIRIPQVKSVRWQNLGEQLTGKMATKIVSLGTAILLIVFCYLLLYFPMKFTLQANIDDASNAQIGLLQKVIPVITSLVLVGMSIAFRVYMGHLASKRNPKDQMQRAKFVLVTSVFFHFVFYLIVPTMFFTFGSTINKTVKLYVISEQARTFIILQLILAIVDVTYQNWKSKKTACLSDQRQGFKMNQSMLHEVVQYPDYPLQIKLQTMFRIWSFALFYAFYLPYMIFYMLIAMLCIYWIEKHNIYRHYSIRKKISIKLETEFLIIYVNLFIIYQCFIYSTNAEQTWKIISAVAVTCFCIFLNIAYWVCFNPAGQKNNNISNTLLGDIDGATYQSEYEEYLQSIQSVKIQAQIKEYLDSLPKQQRLSETRRKTSIIQMGQHYLESDSN